MSAAALANPTAPLPVVRMECSGVSSGLPVSLLKQSPLVWQIVGGTYDDDLAHRRFAVFALVCSLLVPDAARLFRLALKTERTETANENRRLRMLRKTQREKDEPRGLARRIDALHDALFNSYFSVGSTAENISENRPPFPPPHWVGDERPHGARTAIGQNKLPRATNVRPVAPVEPVTGGAW